MRNDQYLLDINGKNKLLTITSCYCIGYSGRNKEMTLKHVEELAMLGVPEPEEIPSLYPMRKSSITQEEFIDVVGDESSGEAEIVLIFGEHEDEIYVTVGSDHTDRSLETVDINKSKQVCDKPFAKQAWPLTGLQAYWDELELVSYVKRNNIKQWELYQSQSVSAILPINEILDFLKSKNIQLKNTIVFCGTVPLIDGFKYGSSYLMEIKDTVKQNIISLQYDVIQLTSERSKQL